MAVPLELASHSRPISWPTSRVNRLQRKHVCCKAGSYFPHHRLHLTSGGVPVPQLWTTTGTWQGRGARLAPEPVTYPQEQLAELLSPEQWQLAYGSLLEDVQAKLQLMALTVAHAHERARTLWHYVVASWPAWTASFCKDVEYVVEYALGILPAWLVSMRAALHSIHNNIKTSAAVKHFVTTASGAARDVSAHISKLRQAVSDTSQLATYRLADPPPLQQLMRLATDLVASKEGGGAANTVRGLTHSMAALTATELAVHLPANSHSKRGRAAMVRNEAAGVAVASSSHGNADTGSVDGRLQLMGLLPVDVQVGLLSGREAAGSGVQHMLIEPLQHAGFIASSGRGPTLAGVIAAASVVLAANVYRGRQRQAQQAEERMLQQVQLQMKAESLAAQRARFRRALDDSQAASAAGVAPKSSSSRRRAASPADADEWEDSLTNSSPLMPAVGAIGGPHTVLPELDAAAAREYQRFMAGARATDVPMWDSHMIEDLPKVSMKELQRQTQKIRSAATEEERAAMEDTESRRQLVEQQLNSQLAELSGAPIGRAAREKWRKEQQQKQQEQLQQAEQRNEESAPAADDGEGGSSKAGQGQDFNPFAISSQARAHWEAEDHLYSDAAPRKGSAAAGNSSWGFGARTPRQQQQPQQARQRNFAGEPRTSQFSREVDTSHTPGPSSSSSSSTSATSTSSSRMGLNSTCRLEQQQQPQPHPEAQPTAANSPAEGTPEWEAHMRDEMLRSGAARRARRQQMMQEKSLQGSQSDTAWGSAGAAVANSQPRPAGTVAPAAAAAPRRSLPEQSLQRPRWPGVASSAAAAADSGVAVLAATPCSATTQSSSGGGSTLLAAVSAKDAEDITAPAAAPHAADMQRLQAAAAATAEAAAEARAAASATSQDAAAQHRRSGSRAGDRQQGDNPFVVDTQVALDDDTAFELGKVVDQETKKIRLQF